MSVRNYRDNPMAERKKGKGRGKRQWTICLVACLLAAMLGSAVHAADWGGALNSMIIQYDPTMYSYSDLLADKEILANAYSDILTVESLGKTADDRDVWLFRIGSANASHKILIHAGIHAREYITCQLVMKQMVTFLDGYRNGGTYGSYTIADLLQDTAIYVIPMVNPDGASISQYGMSGVQTDTIRAKIEEIAALDGYSTGNTDYLTLWKANANGVDLNRQFDALWEDYAGAAHISSDHYKGTAVGSEVESAALIRLTQEQGFERTISYHTHGNVIYWFFKGMEGDFRARTYSFASRLGNLTGYWLDDNYEALDPAGYKDWAVYKLGIPSVTIEVGTGYSPVSASEFSDIWMRNQYVWQETILDILEGGAAVSEVYPEGEMLIVWNCNEYITLRDFPDTSASAITTMPLGSEVTYLGSADNGFSMVSYNGMIGYALSQYLAHP